MVDTGCNPGKADKKSCHPYDNRGFLVKGSHCCGKRSGKKRMVGGEAVISCMRNKRSKAAYDKWPGIVPEVAHKEGENVREDSCESAEDEDILPFLARSAPESIKSEKKRKDDKVLGAEDDKRIHVRRQVRKAD